MSLRFALVTDTHVGLPPSGPAERLSLVYGAIARLAPDFVLHCGDITDTGLPGEYDRYRAAVPAALRGRIRHVPGNHDVRWDPTAKGLYRAHFGAAPYSFDAGGVHVTAFDPTQPLLEPGHCGTAALDWLARDLAGLPAGTPALLFQHFPVGAGHDFVDDQGALLELMARYDVRGLIAGHVHRETVAPLDGLTQVTLRAVRDEAVFYWADLVDGPALAISRMTVTGDGTRLSTPAVAVPVVTVPLSAPPGQGPRRTAAPAPAAARLPGRPWRLRLTGSVQGGIAVAAGRGGRVDRRGRRRVPGRAGVPGPARGLAVAHPARAGDRRPGVGHAARTLFVPSADRHLYALDAATGQVRWRFAADAPVLSEPLAATAGPDGYVVFTAGDRLLAVGAAGPARLVRARPRVLGRAGRVRRRAGLHRGRGRVRPARTTCVPAGKPGRIRWSRVTRTGWPCTAAGTTWWCSAPGRSWWRPSPARSPSMRSAALPAGRFPAAPCTRPPYRSTTAPCCSPPSGASSPGSAWPTAARCGGPAWARGCRTRPGRGRGQRLGRVRTRVARPGAAPRRRHRGLGPVHAGDRYSAPAVAGGVLVAGDQDGAVHGIRLAS